MRFFKRIKESKNEKAGESSEAKPGVIAYRLLPDDNDLFEHSLDDPPGSAGHFRESTHFYPTEPTARSLRKRSWKGGTTGETVTYDTRTKIPFPVLWFASERAKKAGLGAPTLTTIIKEEDIRRALNEPHKWEMLCPKCKERISLKALLDTGKYNAIDFTELFCPHDGEVQMILKRI
jgi:hypothetical protein